MNSKYDVIKGLHCIFLTLLSRYKFSRAVCMVDSGPLITVSVVALSPGISILSLSTSTDWSSSVSPSSLESLSRLDFFNFALCRFSTSSRF